MPIFQKMDKLNERKKAKTVHLRPPQNFSDFSVPQKPIYPHIAHHDRSCSPRPASFSPRPPRSRCLTSSPTVMARVKIPTVPLNPSSSKRRRLLLKESSTESSESNVLSMAVETPRERNVPFFYFNLRHIHITICIFYLVIF